MVVVPSVDEAVRVANDTKYGHSAANRASVPKALAVVRRIAKG